MLHKFWHVPFLWLKHLIAGPAILGLGVLLSLLGVIFITLDNGSFWIMAVGVPLAVAGVSFVIYGIYDIIFGIISPRHQLIDCPFCQNPVKLKPNQEITRCKNCGNQIRSLKKDLN